MDEPILAGYGQVSNDPESELLVSETAFMIASISKVLEGSP